MANLSQSIDCDALIAECLAQEILPSHGHMKLDQDHPFYNDYVDQTKNLKFAGYDEYVVEYRHYQSSVHFSKDVEEKFGQLVSATPLMCWVSEIRPGKCTPWHWDINPWELEHKKLGTLVRYFCFLSKPQPGHIFVTADDAYYNEPQGAVYQYADMHEWHAGANVGLVPKFLLTFTGFKEV